MSTKKQRLAAAAANQVQATANRAAIMSVDMGQTTIQRAMAEAAAAEVATTPPAPEVVHPAGEGVQTPPAETSPPVQTTEPEEESKPIKEDKAAEKEAQKAAQEAHSAACMKSLDHIARFYAHLEKSATHSACRLGDLCQSYIDARVKVESDTKARARAVKAIHNRLSESFPDVPDISRYLSCSAVVRLVLGGRKDIPVSSVKALSVLVDRTDAGPNGTDLWVINSKRVEFCKPVIDGVLASGKDRWSSKRVLDSMADAKAADYDADRAAQIKVARDKQAAAVQEPAAALETLETTTPPPDKTPPVVSQTTPTTVESKGPAPEPTTITAQPAEEPEEAEEESQPPRDEKPGRGPDAPQNDILVPQGAARSMLTPEQQAERNLALDYARKLPAIHVNMALCSMDQPGAWDEAVRCVAENLQSEQCEDFALCLSKDARAALLSILSMLPGSPATLPMTASPELSAVAI